MIKQIVHSVFLLTLINFAEVLLQSHGRDSFEKQPAYFGGIFELIFWFMGSLVLVDLYTVAAVPMSKVADFHPGRVGKLVSRRYVQNNWQIDFVCKEVVKKKSTNLVTLLKHYLLPNMILVRNIKHSVKRLVVSSENWEQRRFKL